MYIHSCETISLFCSEKLNDGLKLQRKHNMVMTYSIHDCIPITACALNILVKRISRSNAHTLGCREYLINKIPHTIKVSKVR